MRTELNSFSHVIVGGDANDLLSGTAENDKISGGVGNDVIFGSLGYDSIDGGPGIDTLSLAWTTREENSLNQEGGNWVVTPYVVTTAVLSESDLPSYFYTLNDIERIEFKDTKLALDLGGDAGTVAKLLGAVFGREAIANKEYVGIGLDMLHAFSQSGAQPNGTGSVTTANVTSEVGWCGTIEVDWYELFATEVVNVSGLHSSNARLVNALWTNVVGVAPTPEQAKPFVDMLNSGTSAGALAVMAADSVLNQTNIDLVGLAQTGLEYI